MARYLIFARRRYEDPLELEGDLEAADDEAASTSALPSLGGDGWIEVRLLPADAARWVIRRA